MEYKAVLFDMDGVLIDSGYAMREASLNMLKECYGISGKHKDFYPFTGMGEKAYIGGVSAKYGVPYEDAMKEKAYAAYGKEFRHLIKTYDGICDLIYYLKEKGYKVAVASSADRVKVVINIETIGLKPDDFDAVLTGSDTEKKKPDPEIYLLAAKAVGIEPSGCIVVEDAISGIKAAENAGMACIGVATTFDEETLKKENCRFVVKETKDIKNLL